jgi:O-succinylbenzoic acid--CoA ligase
MAADADPRSWRLVPLPAPAVDGPLGAWRWRLPGVGAALALLAGLGLRRGQRLGLAGANTPATAALLQAAPLAGLTTVLFNRRLHRDELLDQHRRARVEALLAARGHGLAEAGLPRTHLLPDEFPAVADGPAPAPLAAGEPALVIFTSGTSGRPKAARLAVETLVGAAAGAVDRLALERGDTWLACLPLDHIGGASTVFRAAACGCALALVERFAAEPVGALLDAGGITGASVVPTMLHRLVEVRGARPWPAGLRVLLTGGGPLPAGLIAASARLGLAPCETYGLTEAASQVCTPAPRECAAHPGDCGTPLPGMAVRIGTVDGRTAAADEVGVIEVRGISLFAGYEEQGELATPHPPGNWFATGDLGSLDAHGRLRVRGRRDDLILSGGENVYPAEVEAALERHPAIAEAGVHGLDDAEWGQVVVAALVARGQRPGDAELAAWLGANLAGFKRPRRWRWVGSLPRTATGKLQRHRLATWSG